MHEATEAFSRVSDGVLEVEAELRRANHTALANIIQAIQECERRKLELVSIKDQVNIQELSALLPQLFSKAMEIISVVFKSVYAVHNG